MYHEHELDELRFDRGHGQPIRSSHMGWMVGKAFTAFGRLLSAAFATANVHDAIGLGRPSIMRLIRITMAGGCVVTVASCHVVPVRDNGRRSMIHIEQY